MSSRSTIFLTNENEHFYSEGNDPHYKDGKWIGDILSELYKNMLKMKEVKIKNR